MAAFFWQHIQVLIKLAHLNMGGMGGILQFQGPLFCHELWLLFVHGCGCTSCVHGFSLGSPISFHSLKTFQ